MRFSAVEGNGHHHYAVTYLYSDLTPTSYAEGRAWIYGCRFTLILDGVQPGPGYIYIREVYWGSAESDHNKWENAFKTWLEI